eukprot:14660261-Heterocapsa_arctica.AAC.1
MIKATPTGGLQHDRERKHEQGEAKTADQGMQKPGGGKGGKGGGKESYKQGWNPTGWKMVPQGW